MLVDDLKTAKKKLMRLYEDKETVLLRAELHRVTGGVCYLKLPQLEEALHTFQKAVKAEPQHPEQLERTCAILQQAIDAFWKACEKEDFSDV